MGVDGILNPAGRRRWEQRLGMELAFAVAVDHHTVEVVTPDDVHYRADRRIGEAVLVADPTHFTSCGALPG